MKRPSLAQLFGGWTVGALLAFAPRVALAFGTPACTPNQVIPFPFDLTYGSTTHFIIPEDLNSTSLANGNNAFYFHSVLTNGAVTGTSIHFSAFNTEVNNDRLVISFGAAQLLIRSGPLGAFSTPALPTVTGIGGFILDYQTDESNPSQGFTIDNVTITSCASSPPTMPTVVEAGNGLRSLGILTGTNDTLFFSFAPPAALHTPSHVHVALNTQAPAATTTNFDLYAYCGALPSASSFTAAGTSPGSQEFLDLDASQCTTPWYFAVNSASGAGAFELGISYGDDVPTCVRFESGFGDKAVEDSLHAQFLTSVGGIYGSTAGTALLTPIQFINDPNSDCDESKLFSAEFPEQIRYVNLRTSCSRSITTSHSGGAPEFTDLCTDYTQRTTGLLGSYRIAAHEFGHLLWGLPDEYTDAAGAQCGHSMMSTANTTFFSLCTGWDHLLDPVTGSAVYHDPGAGSSTAPFGDNVSTWDKVAENDFGPPYEDFPFMRQVDTEDNYDYLDFNFNASSPTIVVQDNYQ